MSQPHHVPLLFVGNFLSTSRGSYGVCEALSARFRDAGWPVYTTSRQPRPSARLADMLATVWRRRRDVDVAHVDVFSGRAFIWAEAVCAALRLAGTPYVLTLHGGSLPEFARDQPRRVRRLLATAAAVTAPSAYLQQRMAAYCPDLRMHPNPLDTGLYRFRLRSPSAPRLVWVRAFHDIYNPALAVRVLARLRARFPDARLTMVGPDKGDGSFARTRALARSEGVADAVTFTGGVSPRAVAEWLDRHDVFLNTTNVDNTPVSVLEALASGLPTISTRAGGIPFLLEHERDALLVPVADLDAMHASVERVLMEPDLAARLSAGARRTAERFDWNRVLPLWEQLFRTISQSGRPYVTLPSQLASSR